jgi:TolB-like protein
MTPSGQPGASALWRRIVAYLFSGVSTRLAGIGILAAVPAAVVTMLMMNGSAKTAETWTNDIPRILVVPFLSTDRAAESDIADGLHEEIKHYLLRYDMVQLAADTQAGNSAQPGSYLVLSGTVRSSEGRTRVAIRLADPVTDTLAWSDAIEHQAVGEPVFDVQDMLAAQVAAAAAAPYGGVSQVTFSPELPAQRGNGVYTCRFLTFKYRLTASRQILRQARDCLERNRMAEPDLSEILALSSLVFLDAVRLFPSATDEEKAAALTAARDAARKAIDLTPRSPTALQALAAVDLFDGRTDEAAALLRFGLSLTPNNPELLASLGLVLGASGDWSQAASRDRDRRDQDSPAAGLVQARLGGQRLRAARL